MDGTGYPREKRAFAVDSVKLENFPKYEFIKSSLSLCQNLNQFLDIHNN